MKCIVAVAADWGIGKNGKLLARNKEDMKFFKASTVNQVVIMGRKTLDSFPGGKVLPNRDNIVITKEKSFVREGAIVVHDIESAIEKAKEIANNEKEIFVIGGDSIYKQMLDQCEFALVTKMDQIYDADRYFPNLDTDKGWELIKESEKLEYSDGQFTFCTYKKK